jgi:hypothetical protein
MEFKILNDVLQIGKNKISLPDVIYCHLLIGETVIVLTLGTSKLAKEEAGRNVRAFDANGNLLWQIEASSHGVVQSPNPYTKLTKRNDRSLTAYNVNGIEYVVDLQTGKVTPSSQELGKPRSRPW